MAELKLILAVATVPVTALLFWMLVLSDPELLPRLKKTWRKLWRFVDGE